MCDGTAWVGSLLKSLILHRPCPPRFRNSRGKLNSPAALAKEVSDHPWKSAHLLMMKERVWGSPQPVGPLFPGANYGVRLSRHATSPPHTHTIPLLSQLYLPQEHLTPTLGLKNRGSSTEKSRPDISPHLFNAWARVDSAKRE